MIPKLFYNLLSSLNIEHGCPMPALDAGGMPMLPGGVEETEEESQQEDRQQEQEQAQQRQHRAQNAIAASDFDPVIKQMLREAMASGNSERENLAERVLYERLSPETFRTKLDAMRKEDDNWKNIFKVQREIRKKIQDLKLHAESYAELVPRKKQAFNSLIKDLRSLNTDDDGVDRRLKQQLYKLTQDNVLNKDAAAEIYLADPRQEYSYAKTMERYQNKIAGAERGQYVLKTLVALKNDEARIERRFSTLYRRFDSIVEQNLRKVRSKEYKQQLLDDATESVGVTIEEGVVLRFNQPDYLGIGSSIKKVKISKIEFRTVPVHNHQGDIIDEIPGVPYITLKGEAGAPDLPTMPLGRFKKWVDAADAVEEILTESDVEEALGLKPYGIKVKPGMEISYPRHTGEGGTETRMSYTRITKIENGKIYFSESVLFHPLSQDGGTEMRESLTFGEMVKWWRRYEAEQSMSLQDLREYLGIFNDLENKRYNIDAAENPPITVSEGEVLRYPDETGTIFTIDHVEPSAVRTSDGRTRSFPEFFHWVKTNHIQRAPQKEESPVEQAKKRKIAEALAVQEKFEKEKLHIKEEKAATKAHDITAYAEEGKARGLIPRLKEMWYGTNLLSFQDIFHMVNEVVEFVKRKHDRRSKGRYGDAGSRLPWVVGTEFERVKQAAENEEVGKYKEAMEHWGIERVKRSLHETTSKDEAKACIQTLVHKGEMRWDDHEFWRTLNILTSHYTMRGADLYIPDPSVMPKDVSGEDKAIKAMDALWGEGTGAEWVSENASKYNSTVGSFEFKFKQLENDPESIGGPAGACEMMLKDWREGKYVSPHMYEAMLDGAIKFGKMSAEQKVFYIIAGVLTRQGDNPPEHSNPHGETLLHMDRLGELNSKWLNQFPLLDFFTQVRVFDPFLGKPRKINFNDLQEWAYEYYPDELLRCRHGPGFNRFMWEKMLVDPEVRTRISKGIRNAHNMDHDDAHLFIPPTSPSEILTLTGNHEGQTKYFTTAGYMNAYPGFNQFVVSLANAVDDAKDEKERLQHVTAMRDVVNSFIRYDAILDNRYKKGEGDHRARLDNTHYNKGSVVDPGTKISVYQSQMRNFIMEIGKEYGDNFGWLYGDKTGSVLDREEKRKQDLYEKKLEDLKETIEGYIEKDGGRKMLEIVHRLNGYVSIDKNATGALKGLEGSERPSAAEIAAMKQRALEQMHAAGHGGHH